MTIPLQITFRHIPPSAALENRIRVLAERLTKYSSHILQCEIVVEKPHRHQQGDRFDVRALITVPGRTIAVHSAHSDNPSHEDVYVALRDVFRAARRKLQDYERERRNDVKTHAGTGRTHASYSG